MRCKTSARLTAVDTTSTSTSSGPSRGSGTSRTRSTSGPPFSSRTIARIAQSSLDTGRRFVAQVERQILGHVADEIHQDHANVEPPFALDAAKRVVVAARHDRLQWQHGRLLAHREI